MRFHEIIRAEVKSKIHGYVLTTFNQLLQEELAKYKANVSFQIDDTKWSVITDVNIKYTCLGWFQNDEEECITRIEAGGKMFVGGNLVGDFTIVFEPSRGFINLDQCVHTAMDGTPLNSIKNNSLRNENFQIGNLEENVIVDNRVDDVANRLVGMNFPKKRSIEIAQKIVRTFPDTHDIDSLVDEALNVASET